jgi:ankyrin repeat protein
MSFNLLEESTFIQSCATGNEKKVKELLATNSELIEKVASNGYRPLMFAAKGGSSEMVDLLLQNKADINVLDPKGLTALWLAAKNQHWTMVIRLIDAGAKNLDATPEGGYRGVTVLWFAAYYRQWDLVETLLKAGADLDTIPVEGGYRGVTVLWLAAYYQQWGLVNTLLKADAKHLDATRTEGPDRGKTALWFTARNQQWPLVVKLINEGARDLDATPAEGPERGTTALWFTAGNQQWPLVVKLIDEGARDLDATPAKGPDRGTTALWFTAGNQQWPLVIRLLDEGARDLDATPAEGPKRGATALWFAAKNQHWPLASRLINAGARDLDATPVEGLHRGTTALWWAAGNQQWLLVVRLLEAGARNLEATSVKGTGKDKTALWFAAGSTSRTLQGAQDKSLKLLLKKGASLLPSAHTDMTMISHANPLCTSSNELHKLASQEKKDGEKAMQEKLNFLLDDLADSLNGRINGMTALHTAVLNKNKMMVEALVLKGADVLLKNREGKTAAALAAECGFDAPLLAAYTFLRELETAIDESHSGRSVGKDTQKLEESKLEKEGKGIADTLEGNRNTVKAIFNRKDSFLVWIDRIELSHRNTMWFEYGRLLEKMLPVINEKEVKAVFEKVTREAEDVYQKAQVKLFQYAMIERKERLACSPLSLDDETGQKDNRELMIRYAINAGTNVPPATLNTILSQHIHEDNSSRGNSNLTPREVALRLLEARKNKRKEIEDENKKLKERGGLLMPGAHSLSTGNAGSKTTVASSSSSSTLMPPPPLLLSTGAAVETGVPSSTEQPPSVSRRRKAGDELSSPPDVSKRGRGGDESNIFIVNNALTSEVAPANVDDGTLNKKAY